MQSAYSTASADWAIEHSLGQSYPAAEMQSMYTIASAEWTKGQSLGESYLSAEMQSVYSTASADCAKGHSLGGGDLNPLQRFSRCNSTALADWATGHSFGESYPSAEEQSVYSTAGVRFYFSCITLLFLKYDMHIYDTDVNDNNSNFFKIV